MEIALILHHFFILKFLQDFLIAKMDVWMLPLQTVQRDKLTIRANRTSTRVEMAENGEIWGVDAAVTRTSTEFVRFVPYVPFVRYVLI